MYRGVLVPRLLSLVGATRMRADGPHNFAWPQHPPSKSRQHMLSFRLLCVSLIGIALSLSSCRGQSSTARPFSADISTSSSAMPGPELSGKLYVSGNHLLTDWGPISDVFDLQTRTGWRLFPGTKVYELPGSSRNGLSPPVHRLSRFAFAL